MGADWIVSQPEGEEGKKIKISKQSHMNGPPLISLTASVDVKTYLLTYKVLQSSGAV